MEYNTTRTKLLMPEYGRNVQKMVEYLLTIEDRATRLRNAEAVIELMGTLNPQLKTVEDYKHKLWDHLYQMTDFKLDVDSPYPAPTAEEVFKKPKPLSYPQRSIRERHLGKNLTALLDKTLVETDPEKRQALTQLIGYYMKLAYTNWHKEPVHDDMIKNELNILSGGQLVYETGGYRVHFDTRSNFKQRNSGSGGGNRNFKNNQGGNRNYGNGNGYNKNRKFKNKNK
ncbi:MAG: hypothetical protein BGO69_16635 [Bacteroidetes bacterium 46-16]|nr:MAG: hypothetical protein BGO69_16635 [Bacteroidetes bacterium 46-16]